MPQTPEQRRETFRQLAEKRQQMLQDEREKQTARERENDERTKRQRGESIAEQNANAKRVEEREVWRQEQHSKHEEELEALRLAAEEQARQTAKTAKAEQEKKEEDEQMHALHDHAKEQKVVSRKLQATHEEEDIVGHVDIQLERDLRDVDQVLERTLEHLTQDRRKKIAQMDDDALRQSKSATERFLANKKDAEMDDDPRSGARAFQLTAEHKRFLMNLQDRTAETRMKIESEYVRLKDEVTAQTEQKKARLRLLADQRLREAKTRHENMDDWIDSHR